MSQVRVRDVMTADVAAVREHTPFKEIVRLMQERGVSGVPVLDSSGKHVVGVVTEADLLVAEAEVGRPTRPGLLERLGRRRKLRSVDRLPEEPAAGDLMTRPAITIGAAAPMPEAARLLLQASVKRLPVVDEEGHLVGILSRRDLLRPFLRPDDAIRREIEQDIIGGIDWIARPAVTVRVDRGVVRLDGYMERSSEVQVLTRLARAVAGVVRVEANLTYARSDERRATLIPPPA